MKKSILVFCVVLITLSLTAFGVINWSNSETDLADTATSEIKTEDKQTLDITSETVKSDFFVNVGPRFNSITKEELHKARSFNDFIGQEHQQRIVSYSSLSVIVLEDTEQTDVKVTGDSGVFTAEQLELLKSFDYSTNLMIWANYIEKNKETNVEEPSSWTPYLTIVPETQALYVDGQEALINYLKQDSGEAIYGITKDKFRPGSLYFTVSKDGTVTNAKIGSTSGFPRVDDKIEELILNSPGKWIPALDSNGNAVEQTFVISFGNMGC